MNISIRGTSSVFARSSLARSTTRTRSTRQGCGSPRESPTTTPICRFIPRGRLEPRRVSRGTVGHNRGSATTPGRLEQSAERASYNAWIVLRRDENTDNTSISYYTKGTVIGFLLDAKIRRLTSGAK